MLYRDTRAVSSYASAATRRALVAALLALAGIPACAEGSGPSASGGTAPDAGSDGAGGDINLGDAGQGCSGPRCASDLHAMVDCDNKILKECAPDQGCTPDGACVAACDSAKANKSSLGCEFYAFFPYSLNVDQPTYCYAAFVANTWTTPVTIQVDFDGKALDATQFAWIPKGSGAGIQYEPLPNGKLPPGQAAILFLVSGVGPQTCPAASASQQGIPGADFGPDGTRIGGKMFHVVTDAPVVAYDMFPYSSNGGSVASATLLLPTSAWGTNYVALAPWPYGDNSSEPKLEIAALEDATSVTISPSAAIVGGNGVEPTGKGQPRTYTLTKGQFLQIMQKDELTGSPIQADKPIGVWGNSNCINIDGCCCDGAHQQIAPVQALGHEYVAVRYRDRVPGKAEAPPFRIAGAVDGTALTYEPKAPVGAPKTISLGETVTFRSDEPFVVRSQDADHPFSLGGYMTGGGEIDDMVSPQSFGARGDPEWVNVIPPEQYLSSYVFFADPTYKATSLVVIRRAAGGAFKDVVLDCAGALSGWEPLTDKYEYTRLDMVLFDFMPQGGCDTGPHAIHSDAPFAVTVWGMGQHSSYAYPAGAGARAINSVVVVPVPK